MNENKTSPVAASSTPPAQPRRSLLLKRTLSFAAVFLCLALVGPEFKHMPTRWVLFWVVLLFSALALVWVGAARNRVIEGIGWFLLLVVAVLIFG